MSRNAESHFALNPVRMDMSRSRFNRNSSVKTSFNVGDIIPFYLDEVLPGDTFSIKTNKVVRMQTLLTPCMDNIYLDTYWFFVPNRLVWTHWKEFMGENNTSPWIPTVTYSVPQLTTPSSGFSKGTIGDYLGIPIGIGGLSVSALPFRAYALIINEWFRDENLQQPLVISTGDANVTGVNGSTFVNDLARGGKPYIAAKYRDYFSSCLPSPMKGPDVTIPVAEGAELPVVPLNKFAFSNGDAVGQYPIVFNQVVSGSRQNNIANSYGNVLNGDVTSTISSLAKITSSDTGKGLPSNLFAIQQQNVVAATISQLRMAFQIQKWYERAARGGTRYIETLKSHFGVTSPDSRLQRPEYLGGNRIPININQVIQQSGTVSGSTPQGNTAAFSLTTDSHADFTQSFTEHGLLLGLMVARYDHTYQQGVERMWSRKSIFDYYWPEFANISEQGVRNKEIYAQSDSVIGITGQPVNDEIFGYQEAWADYRYKPSRVSGEMRSAAANSLDVWHLGDKYTTLPSLSDAWIREDKSNVDRVLAVQSNVADQLFADIYVQNKTTRPMPMYSIPGLIDHH